MEEAIGNISDARYLLRRLEEKTKRGDFSEINKALKEIENDLEQVITWRLKEAGE